MRFFKLKKTLQNEKKCEKTDGKKSRSYDLGGRS
jgi:hypothetical protein